MANTEKDKERVKDALMKRALGYEYEERIVETDSQGRAQKIKIVKKHVPPDTKAMERILYFIRVGKW